MQITPTQFLETVNAINECLISAHSLRGSFVDNALAFFTLQLSRLVLKSHYEKVSNVTELDLDVLLKYFKGNAETAKAHRRDQYHAVQSDRTQYLMASERCLHVCECTSLLILHVHTYSCTA